MSTLCDYFVYYLKHHEYIIIYTSKTLHSHTEILHTSLCVHIMLLLSVIVLIIRMKAKLVRVVTRQNANFIIENDKKKEK